MATFSEDFFSGVDFGAVLAILSCYSYGANASEAVGKISTDEKDYHSHNLSSITVQKISY